MKIPPMETRSFMRTDGRKDKGTDGHDEASIRLSQFCERA